MYLGGMRRKGMASIFFSLPWEKKKSTSYKKENLMKWWLFEKKLGKGLECCLIYCCAFDAEPSSSFISQLNVFSLFVQILITKWNSKKRNEFYFFSLFFHSFDFLFVLTWLKHACETRIFIFLLFSDAD